MNIMTQVAGEWEQSGTVLMQTNACGLSQLYTYSMRVVAVIMLLFAANLSAGSKLRRIDPTQVSKYQEYVEVKDYRSLDIDIGTPVELISKYQPLKQHQISDEYYRSLMYHPADYSRSGNARPYRSGKLVELTVPPR